MTIFFRIDICNIFFQIYVCTMDFQHISILFRAIWSPSIPEIAATPHSFNGIVDGHISAWKQNMIIQKKSQHIYQTIIFPRFCNGLYSNCSVKKKPTQNGAFQSAEGESSERDLLWVGPIQLQECCWFRFDQMNCRSVEGTQWNRPF